MATIKLKPSTKYLSNSSYLSVSDESNMYTDTDSDTYATVTNSRTSTTSYYLYLRGFDFSSVPSGAIIDGFTVRLKAREQGASTSTSYRPMLCNNTTTITGSSSVINTTTQVIEFSGVSADYDTIKGYGSNFGIQINCRRNSRNTTSYVYVYGAEIEVEYHFLVERTITTSCNEGGSIDPLGSSTVYDGDRFDLNITPNNGELDFTVTDNGSNVTSNVTIGSTGGTVTSTPTAYTTSGSITGTYYQQAVGKDHNTSNTTNNNYASSSGSTATIKYSFDVSDIPSNAEINSVSCKVKGHAESTSNSSRKSECRLYSGSTAKSDAVSFTSTTDQVIELTGGTWTRSELNNVSLNFEIGYYGGNVSGATLSVDYSLPSSGNVYVYTIDPISGDHAIVVTFPSTTQKSLSIKINGSWVTASTVYRKVDGSWVEVTDLTTIDTEANYVY